MAVYETIFISVPSDATSGTLDAIVEKAKGIIETGKGTILSIDNWGTRPMEYGIGKQEKGVYVCMTYEGDRPLTIELERFLKLTEGVLRTMTVRASDKHPQGRGEVSSMVRKNDEATSPTGTAEQPGVAIVEGPGSSHPPGAEEQGGSEGKHE